MKFSPKCRSKKWVMIYTILGRFCSFLNKDGANNWPQIMSRKTPGSMCAYKIVNGTVNSKVFARVLFCETSHMRSFVKIKTS